MIDWLNDNSGAVQAGSAVVLALTLVTVAYYAYQTRRQAEATGRMAESIMRPVVRIRTEQIDELQHPGWYRVFYQNIGNGPAMNIALRLEPTDGLWQEHPMLVVMAVTDPEEQNVVEILNPMADEGVSVVAEYADAGGSMWRTTLKLDRDLRVLRNGESLVERVIP